ncbi:hypothetical protein GQX73_g6115 [Xylaria multiplex]|uniref:Uncharacterized protein n=1 Tax=Xylaria multiplex TaxID=323545 RepID=A0A7C8MPW0_9PEZI|nr:hypothetical protein GQX73_g6115 [Xylaria multiplex]
MPVALVAFATAISLCVHWFGSLVVLPWVISLLGFAYGLNASLFGAMVLFTAALVLLWEFIASSSYSVLAICLQSLLAISTDYGWWTFWPGIIALRFSGAGVNQWSMRQSPSPVIDALVLILFFGKCLPWLGYQHRLDHSGFLISLASSINLGRLNSWFHAYLTHIHPAFPLMLHYLLPVVNNVLYSMIETVKTGVYIISYTSWGTDHCCPDWRIRQIHQASADRRERERQNRPSRAVLRQQYEENARRGPSGPQGRRQPGGGSPGLGLRHLMGGEHRGTTEYARGLESRDSVDPPVEVQWEFVQPTVNTSVQQPQPQVPAPTNVPSSTPGVSDHSPKPSVRQLPSPLAFVRQLTPPQASDANDQKKPEPTEKDENTKVTPSHPPCQTLGPGPMDIDVDLRDQLIDIFGKLAINDGAMMDEDSTSPPLAWISGQRAFIPQYAPTPAAPYFPPIAPEIFARFSVRIRAAAIGIKTAPPVVPKPVKVAAASIAKPLTWKAPVSSTRTLVTSSTVPSAAVKAPAAPVATGLKPTAPISASVAPRITVTAPAVSSTTIKPAKPTPPKVPVPTAEPTRPADPADPAVPVPPAAPARRIAALRRRTGYLPKAPSPPPPDVAKLCRQLVTKAPKAPKVPDAPKPPPPVFEFSAAPAPPKVSSATKAPVSESTAPKVQNAPKASVLDFSAPVAPTVPKVPDAPKASLFNFSSAPAAPIAPKAPSIPKASEFNFSSAPAAPKVSSATKALVSESSESTEPNVPTVPTAPVFQFFASAVPNVPTASSFNFSGVSVPTRSFPAPAAPAAPARSMSPEYDEEQLLREFEECDKDDSPPKGESRDDHIKALDALLFGDGAAQSEAESSEEESSSESDEDESDDEFSDVPEDEMEEHTREAEAAMRNRSNAPGNGLPVIEDHPTVSNNFTPGASFSSNLPRPGSTLTEEQTRDLDHELLCGNTDPMEQLSTSSMGIGHVPGPEPIYSDHPDDVERVKNKDPNPRRHPRPRRN